MIIRASGLLGIGGPRATAHGARVYSALGPDRAAVAALLGGQAEAVEYARPGRVSSRFPPRSGGPPSAEFSVERAPAARRPSRRKLDGGRPWWRRKVFANWAACL